MYSYTAATLAIRAKCSSSHCLFLPNDQSYCCHRSFCQSCSHFQATGLFPASPRILSGYFFSQSALIPSGTLFVPWRRRLRVPFRSLDIDAGIPEMMGLLAEQDVIFPGEEPHMKEVPLQDLSWKKGRREMGIGSVEEYRGSSKKEAMARRRSSRRNEQSSSSVFSTTSFLGGSELNKAESRRIGGKSVSGNGNTKEGSKLDEVDIAEKDVREVHEHVDDSWRDRKDSYKRDVVMDSRKDVSLKTNASFRWPAVKGAPQQASSRAKVSVRGTQTVTRTSESQRDDVERTSVSSNVRKVERGESSIPAARQDSDVNQNQFAHHTELRRCSARECKVSGFHYSDVRGAAYPGNDYEEKRRIMGREQTYTEQHTQQVRGDKNIHPDWQAVEEDESRRNIQRLSQVSVFQDNDFESASYVHNERVKGMDVGREELQMFEENRVNEKMEDERNLNQSRRGKVNLFNRRASEHDESRRNIQMLSEVSEIHGGNVEATSYVSGKRVTGMEFSSDFFQGSDHSTKDIGIQVGINEAYEDKTGMPRFNATSSQGPPASRVDPEEYRAVLTLNQVSSMIEQPSLSKNDYVQYSARAESERGTKEFDLTRGNKKSSIQETHNSRIENKRETFLEENSSVLLSQGRNESQSHLTGKGRQSTAMHLASSGSVNRISSSLSNQGEVDNQASRVDIHQIRNETIESARRLDKSSALHEGKFLDELPKEIVSLNDPGSAPNVSSGINIEEQGMNDSRATLKIQNKKEISSEETSSVVLQQERKERHNSLITGGSSITTTSKMASTGSTGVVSSSLQADTEVGNRSGGDDIHQMDIDTIESARRLDKSSAQHVGEFVKNLQQEIMILDKSGKEPNITIGIQIEATGRRETRVTNNIEAAELNESRSYRDERYVKESGSLSSFGSGVKGPSDEMWDVQGLPSKEPSIAEVPNEDSSTGGAIGFTSTTTSESVISRRSHKSLWSYVADIIRMSWVLRGQNRSLTLKSDKSASSNESISSEAWFSGPEADEDGIEDEKQDKERSGLTKKSAPMQEPVKLAFGESKFRDGLTVRESNSSISSGLMKSGLSTRISSLSMEAEKTEDARPSQETLSSLAMVQQQPASKADAAPPSIINVVESRVGNKVEVLKPSSSYSAGMKEIGFSSRIIKDTDIPQIEATQIRDNNISSFENLEQPSVSTVDYVIPRVSDTKVVDLPFNEVPKLQLDPFREKLPEVEGTKLVEMKQRKLHRNKQVLSEQFDEWEAAFKHDTEQKKLHEFFMREAILEAKKGADTWEVPVGAVLVQNGKIIARGCNMVEEMRDSTAHAEMICIREASNLLRTWRLAETTLYVTLEPCPMCAGAILQARIDTVVWGAPNRLSGADGSWVRLFPCGDGVSTSIVPTSQMVGPIHPFHPKISIIRGVLATECGDVMQQFFKLRRKKDKKQEPSRPSCLPISNRPTNIFTKLHNIFSMMFCLW